MIRTLSLLCFFSIFLFLPSPADAHRSGCHRWHSCASDTGSYTCGDLGKCGFCPDNQFCEGSQPRVREGKVPRSHPRQPSSPQGSRGPRAFTFESVTYHGCADGDTCSFTIHGVHPLLGHRIAIRLAGIDTPEMHGKCEEEKALAREAKMFVESLLGQAQDIHLVGAKRGKYFRIVATVEADGQDVSDLLIQEGLAVPYEGGTKGKNWCA